MANSDYQQCRNEWPHGPHYVAGSPLLHGPSPLCLGADFRTETNPTGDPALVTDAQRTEAAATIAEHLTQITPSLNAR